MKKLLYVFSLFFVVNSYVYSQTDSFNQKHTSEMVFLKDSNLKLILSKIISKDSLCKMKTVKWSVEFMKNDILLITKYSLENLIFNKGITNVFTTIIDNEFVFISFQEKTEDVFVKSGYFVDLNFFIGKENFSTIDYSFWVIQKTDSKKYKIIKEKKYPCDK